MRDSVSYEPLSQCLQHLLGVMPTPHSSIPILTQRVKLKERGRGRQQVEWHLFSASSPVFIHKSSVLEWVKRSTFTTHLGLRIPASAHYPPKAHAPPWSLQAEGSPPSHYIQVIEESLASQTISGQVPRPTSKQCPEGKMLHILFWILSPTGNQWIHLPLMKGHSPTSHYPIAARYGIHFNFNAANACKLSNTRPLFMCSLGLLSKW